MADIVDIVDGREMGRDPGWRSPSERLLLQAAQLELSDVVVIGTNCDGSLYVDGPTGDPQQMLWAIEKARLALLAGDMDGAQP